MRKLFAQPKCYKIYQEDVENKWDWISEKPSSIPSSTTHFASATVDPVYTHTCRAVSLHRFLL